MGDEEVSIGKEPEADHGPAGEPYTFDEFVFLPEGFVPPDPTGQVVSYTIMRQSGVNGVIGVLYVAPNGAIGFIPTKSSGDVGQDWQQQWALRGRDARTRYQIAGDEWDAQSWFDYWIEKSGMVVQHEGPYLSDYDELVAQFKTM